MTEHDSQRRRIAIAVGSQVEAVVECGEYTGTQSIPAYFSVSFSIHTPQCCFQKGPALRAHPLLQGPMTPLVGRCTKLAPLKPSVADTDDTDNKPG